MKSKALWLLAKQSSDRLVLYSCNRVGWFGHFVLLAGRAASSDLIAVDMATALHLHTELDPPCMLLAALL
jgi:hypothetical protein